MSAAVVFEHVWKKFRRGPRHDSLRDLLPALVRGLTSREARVDLRPQEFWAVRDVSFEVRPGSALGVIGPNGAGKSTVLKLLTGILRPTRGRREVHGRIGALIEVAAGFHPDLSGRETVYLQGAIMGMRRHELASRFDEIVEFAGVSDFIDTPVKHYSSGMNARLGFAIAAHLEPDILIIDEVLAVGDFAFQAKAFDRLHTIVAQGIPAVVVSHQLDRIASLCTQGLLLERGGVVCQGTAAECIGAYVQRTSSAAAGTAEGIPLAITGLSIAEDASVPSGGHTRLRIGARCDEGRVYEQVGLRVRAMQTGEIVFSTDTHRCRVALPDAGAFTLDVELQMNVQPGMYVVETTLFDTRLERLLAMGPSVCVRVTEGRIFRGAVQMNPSVQLSVDESVARRASLTAGAR